MADTFTAGWKAATDFHRAALIAHADLWEKQFRQPALAYRFAAEMVGKHDAPEAPRIARGAPLTVSAVSVPETAEAPLLDYLASIPALSLQAAE